MLRKVQVENGLVKGLSAADPRITSFKGIPYAAPPLGANRWRAPQPAANWEGVLNALEFAPISLQAPTGVNKDDIYTREWAVDPEIPMDEDCLYLNVWTPACDPGEKLPVFVWYFGGGLQVGNTAEMEFDGERIARRGIVVVSINYRLNVFGYLCHPEMTAESPDAPANFGHLDQQFGTRWVKRNIAAFGGDPDNITIGGQSAGGASVMYMLTSPQNEGLFQKTIVQSGIFTKLFPGQRAPSARTLPEAEEDGCSFFQALNVRTLAEARALDANIILEKALALKGHWGSVLDERFITGDAFKLFCDNKCWKAPVLMGHTSSEFHIHPEVGTLEAFKAMAAEMFGESADTFLSLCGTQNGELENVLKQSSVSGIEYAIRVAANANAKTGSGTPIYYYEFDAEIPGWDNPGTFHSVDIWFFFETLAKCWRPFVGKHYDVARQMCDYWANFIRSGDPNGKDATGQTLPQWDSYSSEAPYRMVFADTSVFEKKNPSALMDYLVGKYCQPNI